MPTNMLFIGGIADGERCMVEDGRDIFTVCESPTHPTLLSNEIATNKPLKEYHYRRRCLHENHNLYHVMVHDDNAGIIKSLIEGYGNGSHTG